MPIFRTGGASALLLAAHACALAQTSSDTLPQVIVTADDGRAQSTTTAITVGRNEIVRHGDTRLSDVLKRQPGITLDGSPGKDTGIRMQGLGSGYVAILLNGLPAPAGFSLESMSPDLVERIEIRRSATAETSSQAVAGTINVILRRAGPAGGASTNEVKVGSAFVNGRAAPQLVAAHSSRVGALAYTLTATLKRQDNPITAAITEQGVQPDLLRYTASFEQQIEDTLELAPRLAWQAGAADSVTAQSYVRRRRIAHAKSENETTVIGTPTAFAHAVQTYTADPVAAYADLVWTRKFDSGARLATKLSGFYATRDAAFAYRGLDAQDSLLATHRVASGPTEREWTFSGSWRRPLWDRHFLAAGWEWSRKDRNEYRREQRTDAVGVPLFVSDEAYRAQVARSAVFIQDEWDINAAWSAYAGLRKEGLHTTGAGNAAAPVDVKAGAWSPVFQTLFKPQRPEGATSPRDQFRVAVSRTYKAPGITQLMPRRYAVDNANSATNPDQQGNPALRPELATNIDLAWERYLGKDDMASVSIFQKRIRDITLDRLVERAGVWTAMPDNQGNATVRGIGFDGKAVRGPISMRMNLARNWSRLDRVPGPDNRIDGQAPWSGNAGLDYAAATNIDLGGSGTWRSWVAVRASAQLASDDGAKGQFDLYAVWKHSHTSRLRLSVADLLHRDVRQGLVYDDGSRLVRSTVYRVHPVWRLVWEQSL